MKLLAILLAALLLSTCKARIEAEGENVSEIRSTDTPLVVDNLMFFRLFDHSIRKTMKHFESTLLLTTAQEALLQIDKLAEFEEKKSISPLKAISMKLRL